MVRYKMVRNKNVQMTGGVIEGPVVPPSSSKKITKIQTKFYFGFFKNGHVQNVQNENTFPKYPPKIDMKA
jgi:hypothetical protein